MNQDAANKGEDMLMHESEPQALARIEPPSNLLEVIAQAVCDPRMDVEKMERLFQLQKEILAEERKVEFDAALSRLQSKLPQIDKYGKGKNSKYGKLEDVDVIIRPFLADEGFAFSFDEEARTDKTVTFKAVLSHRGGHREIKRLTVSIDAAAKNREGTSIRPAIQDDGSTVSYARRYLITMHLNLIFKDEDTDGEKGKEPISAEQVKDLETMIADVKGDKSAFLEYMRIERLEDMCKRDWQKAITAIEAKRKRK